MENNPLFLYKVIEQDGRKTGYLVYNEFKAGINDGDASYLEQMLQIFQWFKQQGVTDFILDLRYNQGGAGDLRTTFGLLVGSCRQSGTGVRPF